MPKLQTRPVNINYCKLTGVGSDIVPTHFAFQQIEAFIGYRKITFECAYDQTVLQREVNIVAYFVSAGLGAKHMNFPNALEHPGQGLFIHGSGGIRGEDSKKVNTL
jgi:hypothetical protein